MSGKTSVYLKKMDFKFSIVIREITSYFSSLQGRHLRARFTQGKEEYEITALDMVLDRPEHHDLTVLFRVVPSEFGGCTSAYEKYFF